MNLVKLILLYGFCSAHCRNENIYKEIYPFVNMTAEDDLNGHLFFGLVQSFGKEFNGSGNIAGIKVALDRINNSTEILPGYILHYTLTDSQCNRSIALDALFKQLLSNDSITKLAILGCGCSPATEPTAEVSHYYNVIQISCSSASTELIDRSRFRHYFQLLQTMIDLAEIYIGLIRRYKWRYLSIIVQNENLHTVTIDSLKRYMDSNGIGYSEKIFESKTGIKGVQDLIDFKARVFIVASYETHARAFLCEAYKYNIKYPSHLIILLGWYLEEWWLVQDSTAACSRENRIEVMTYILTVHHFNFDIPDDIVTTSGINGSEFKKEEAIKIKGPPAYKKIQSSTYCYDAVWTLAYALHQTLQDLGSGSISIEYENTQFHQRMFHFVSQTNITGITGHIQFDAQGIRTTNNRQVFQFMNVESGLKQIKIGEVVKEADGNFIFDSFYSDATLWPAGVPRDGVATNVTITVHNAVTSTLAIAAMAGIIFTVVCLIFNFHFRKQKLMKLSSPKLNYLIGGGAIVLYSDIFVLVIPTREQDSFKILCATVPWFTAIGYSLCYGTIIAKMTRVYYIFRILHPNSKNHMTDWKLALGVLLLVMIDLVLLVMYTSLGLKSLVIETTLNKENPSHSEKGFVLEYNYIYVCKSKAQNIFLGILYGYKAVLQIVALIMSFTTRKVKVQGLNDALYMAVAIYITSLLWAILLVSTYSLVEYLNTFLVIYCLVLFLGSTTIIMLVFIPKMILIYKDPLGDAVFPNNDAHSSNVGKLEQPTEIAALKEKIAELEHALSSQQ